MKLTLDHLDDICGNTRNAARKIALCNFLNERAAGYTDITTPHRLAQFLSQVLHESARLDHVREIWGPTAAQRRYEGRRDLGNLQAGDGERYKGRDIIQVTGRSNYRSLTEWARGVFGREMPDFEAHPEVLEAPEHLGIGALWYWMCRVPAKYVEAGDLEMVTRKINGGLNGYDDRLVLFDRAALVLLGRNPDDVRGFQGASGLIVDGVSGPRTRAELHRQLMALPPPATEVEAQGIGAAIAALFMFILEGVKKWRSS